MSTYNLISISGIFNIRKSFPDNYIGYSCDRNENQAVVIIIALSLSL